MEFFNFFNLNQPESIFDEMSEQTWLHARQQHSDYFKNVEKRIEQYKNSYKKQDGI